MRQRGLSLSTAVAVFLCSWYLFAGDAVRADNDLQRQLANLRKQLENPALEVEKREQIALDLAAALDRAAQEATTSPERRKQWTEAINLLDQFEKDHPGHAQSHQFQFQAAVYLWARGRLWADQWELTLSDSEARESAVENLDVAVSRFRALSTSVLKTEKVLAENIRFRLAQALVDRSRLDPEASDERQSRLKEAAQGLEKPMEEPTLLGFALLLRAEVLAKLGDEAGARSAIAAAEKGSPPPSPEAILEAKVGLATAGNHFDQAIKAIEESAVESPGKALLLVRTRLAQRARASTNSTRSEVETALFKAARSLQDSPSSESRLALLALGRGIKEPEATQGPDAWDLLAEAAIAMGNLPRAIELEAKGADRAEALGQPEKAAALRLRSGALLFRSEQFLKADARLSQVADDPRAGDARSKAGLLRIMARARALAAKQPGATQASYVAALESQIRDFPKDSSASEARWLLGKVELVASNRARAETLWADIPRTDPRWLDARLAIAKLRQGALDTQRINNDRELVRQRYNDARSFLDASLTQCRTDPERAAINLAVVRLELTPNVGQAEEARRLCDVIQRSASRTDQRDQARRLQIVAVASQNHFLAAEKEARAEVSLSPPASLLELARLLDFVATDTESSSDLQVRRFGLIMRVLVARVLERQEELSEVERGEARLRQTRAYLFIGDETRARNSITSEWGTPTSLDDRTLRDMADTYLRLGAFDHAADVQRLRSRRAATGSPTWFEARYGLALADYRAGKSREAAKLIDATAILHPDLGGGELREKFVRLRERLTPEEE